MAEPVEVTTKYTISRLKRQQFGEHNAQNNLHGRGISLYTDGFIRIQYWENGQDVAGNYIEIYKDGRFVVGSKQT